MSQKRIIVLRNSIVLPFSTTQITVTFKKYSRNERVNLRDLNRKDGLKYESSKTKKTNKKKNSVKKIKSLFQTMNLNTFSLQINQLD